MITDEIYETGVEIIDSQVVVYHVAEPDYSFLFGSTIGEDGEIVFQKFQKDRQRVTVDPDRAKAYLEV